MNILEKAILRFYDDGYTVRKVSERKFAISKKLINHDKKEVMVEYVKGNEIGDVLCEFIMYKPYAKKFDSWGFTLDYPYYIFDSHYKHRCEYDLHRTLKTVNLLNTRLNMKLFIKHKDFNAYPEYKISTQDYRNLYNHTITKIWKLIHKYDSDPEVFLRDKNIPKSLKYVAIACKGDYNNFIYGEGWETNTHYLHKLVMDVLEYLDKHDAQI